MVLSFSNGRFCFARCIAKSVTSLMFLEWNVFNETDKPKHRKVEASIYFQGALDNIDLNKSGAYIENKKNQNKRWIYWSRTTNEILKIYLQKRGLLTQKTNALFFAQQPTKNANPITTRSIERIVKRCCVGAGVKGIVPYSFRHGMAHNVLEKGGTVADIQKMLGHKSSLSSMKYLQLSDIEHERRAKMFLMC